MTDTEKQAEARVEFRLIRVRPRRRSTSSASGTAPNVSRRGKEIVMWVGLQNLTARVRELEADCG